MSARCSEKEFIALWQEHQSSLALASILNTDERAVNRRRRGIERRQGIMLQSPSVKSPDFNVTIPQNGIRVNVEMESGMIIVGSDAHYWPGIISTAHRAFVMAIKELKPRMVVMNGDAFDGASVSRHDRIQWEVRPNVKQELDAVHDRMAEIEQVAGNAKLHWTWGNHDMRFNSRLSGYASQFEGVHGFSLADHFAGWRFSTSVMVNDHTMIKHRLANGIHAVYNNALKSGASMVTGHLHSLKVTPWTDYTGTRYGVDTGTLAAPTGEQFTYAEDGPANHRSGFAVLTFHNGLLLPPEMLQVIDEEEGLVCFRGQVVQV